MLQYGTNMTTTTTNNNQNSKNNNLSLSLMVVLLSAISIGLLFVTNSTNAQPSPQLKVSTANEIMDDKLAALKEADNQVAEKSFHQFISSSENQSTIIGQHKPNATVSELTSFRNKIAATILSMQENEKRLQQQKLTNTNNNDKIAVSDAECYIEVTRIEKIPGKCRRASGGQPICQSNQLISITGDCN